MKQKLQFRVKSTPNLIQIIEVRKRGADIIHAIYHKKYFTVEVATESFKKTHLSETQGHKRLKKTKRRKR